MSIAIDPDLGVVLTAPAGVPLPRLDRVVKQKARWIVERLDRRPAEPRLAAKEFVSGESFRYLGRQHRLRVQERMVPAEVRLDQGRFIVVVRPSLSPRARVGAVRRQLVAWYREHAGPRLRERVAFWAGRLRLAEPPLVLADQARRWGSCTASGVVRLNWRIVQAPGALIDYVVAHEIAHLKHHEHSPRFWKALAVAMPEYEARREQLREMGPGLEW